MYQTIFAASEKNETNEEVIRSMVAQMGFLAGKSVSVEKQIVVSTDDINLSSALDALADSMKTADAKPEDKVRKRRAKGEPKPNAGSKSYTNEKTHQVYSKQAINKMLAAGELENGTTFISWKGDRWVVLDGQMIKEPQA